MPMPSYDPADDTLTLPCVCPYCRVACTKDADAVNGIRPAAGSGCEFCNPSPEDDAPEVVPADRTERRKFYMNTLRRAGVAGMPVSRAEDAPTADAVYPTDAHTFEKAGLVRIVALPTGRRVYIV